MFSNLLNMLKLQQIWTSNAFCEVLILGFLAAWIIHHTFFGACWLILMEIQGTSSNMHSNPINNNWIPAKWMKLQVLRFQPARPPLKHPTLPCLGDPAREAGAPAGGAARRGAGRRAAPLGGGLRAAGPGRGEEAKTPEIRDPTTKNFLNNWIQTVHSSSILSKLFGFWSNFYRVCWRYLKT